MRTLHVLLALAMAACSTATAAPSSEPEGTPAPLSSLPSHGTMLPEHPRVLAFTADARLAVVDALTGRPLAEGQPVAGVVRDVAYDPWRHGALVVATDDEEQAATITSWPVASVIGAASLVATLDGDARALAVPRGALVFERGYGDRWRLIEPGAPPSASLLAPAPASIAVAREGDRVLVRALAHDASGEAPSLSLFAVDATNALDPLGGALDAPTESDPPTARAVTRRGAALIVDVRGGVLTLRAETHRALGTDHVLARVAEGARIEAAALLDDRTLALLLTGPGRLVVVALDDGEDARAVATVPVEGVRVESTFFSRDLLALGVHRLLVATSSGVIAFEIGTAHDAIEITRDVELDGSGLRGPLDRIPDD